MHRSAFTDEERLDDLAREFCQRLATEVGRWHVVDDPFDESLVLVFSAVHDEETLREEASKTLRRLNRDGQTVEVEDPEWECPNCGDDGALMHRPGSKDTCATCFWVVGGNHNDRTLADFDVTFRQAQRLLYTFDYEWWGTPGDLGTRLRGFCQEMGLEVHELSRLLADLRGEVNADA